MNYDEFTNSDSLIVQNIAYLLLLFTYPITLLVLKLFTVYDSVSRLCCKVCSAMYLL